MKWIYKLCYWILGFQKKPMFVRIHSDRIKVIKFEQIYSNYFIFQYGMEYVEDTFYHKVISQLVKEKIIVLEKQPAGTEYPDMHVKFSATIKILQ